MSSSWLEKLERGKALSRAPSSAPFSATTMKWFHRQLSLWRYRIHVCPRPISHFQVFLTISFACSEPSFSVIHHLDAYRYISGMSECVFSNLIFQIDLEQLHFKRAAQNDRYQRFRVIHRMGPGVASSPRPALHSN